MKKVDRKREAPSLFDVNPIMIGRNSSTDTWRLFRWGDKTDCTWEYAPFSDANMRLINTSDAYNEWNLEKKTFKIPVGSLPRKEVSKTFKEMMDRYKNEV